MLLDDIDIIKCLSCNAYCFKLLHEHLTSPSANDILSINDRTISLSITNEQVALKLYETNKYLHIEPLIIQTLYHLAFVLHT